VKEKMSNQPNRNKLNDLSSDSRPGRRPSFASPPSQIEDSARYWQRQTAESRAQVRELEERFAYLAEQISWEPGHRNDSLLDEVQPEDYALYLLKHANNQGASEERGRIIVQLEETRAATINRQDADYADAFADALCTIKKADDGKAKACTGCANGCAACTGPPAYLLATPQPKASDDGQ